MKLYSGKCIQCPKKSSGEIDGYPFCFLCALNYRSKRFASEMRRARLERRGY